MGETPSVAWELDQVVKNGWLGKTIIMVPPGLNQTRESRIQKIMARTGMEASFGLMDGSTIGEVLGMRFMSNGEILVALGDDAKGQDYQFSMRALLAAGAS